MSDFDVKVKHFLKKSAASARQPVFRDRIFEICECGVLSEKFCSEGCGISHLRINKKTSGRRPCRPSYL